MAEHFTLARCQLRVVAAMLLADLADEAMAEFMA